MIGLWTEKWEEVPADLPSGKFTANAAWLTLAATAYNLTRAAGHLASVFHARARTGTIQWLNAGVDPSEVAERAGNSVEVLLSRYAKCIEGRQEIANRKIEQLLSEYG